MAAILFFPVSSQGAMTCVEPRTETNVHVKVSPSSRGWPTSTHVRVRLSGPRREEDRLYFSRCHGEGQGDSGGEGRGGLEKLGWTRNPTEGKLKLD